MSLRKDSLTVNLPNKGNFYLNDMGIIIEIDLSNMNYNSIAELEIWTLAPVSKTVIKKKAEMAVNKAYIEVTEDMTSEAGTWKFNLVALSSQERTCLGEWAYRVREYHQGGWGLNARNIY